MSTSTSQAEVVKTGRTWQVRVDGKDVGKAHKSKKAADAAVVELNGSGKAPESTPEPTPTPTPTEQANAQLEGLDAKAAEAQIKKWQAVLGDAREAGKGDAAIVLEAYVAAGDAYMSALEEGDKPQSGGRSDRAAKAAEARAKKAADAEAAKVAEASGEERRTSGGRKAPRPSTIAKDGEQVCSNVNCVVAPGQPQPVTKFPTISGEKRGKECRKCRDTRLAAKKAA